MGKFLAGLILVTAIVAGAALYYLQIYAFYDEVSGNGTDDVLMTSMVSGQPEPVLYDDFGRGYVWHQINHCGEVVFDGQPAPEDCPEPPNGN